jgi:hypothetical protein
VKTHKKVWLVIGILACSTAAIFAAGVRRTQKPQKHFPFTIAFKAKDHYDDGRVVEAFTETRYISSTGDWRSIRQLPSGAVIERVGLAGRGIYTVDAQAQKMWFNSPYSGTFPKLGERQRSANYLRTETVLGYVADVVKLEVAGKSFELYQAPDLSGFVIKQIEHQPGLTRVIEPTSITAGEPDAQSLTFNEYPEDRSAYVPTSKGFKAQTVQISQQDENRKRKTLREVGKEREVEKLVPNLEHNKEYNNLASLATNSTAIVVARITKEVSSFDSDDYINTTYTLDVQRVLKDITSTTPLGPNDARPLPLTSPLKIVRAGGVVYVNGHRVSEKLKGSELLTSGKRFVLFLRWSPAFKSYHLMGGASGAFLVQDDQQIKPLGSELKLRDGSLDLETFIVEVMKVRD